MRLTVQIEREREQLAAAPDDYALKQKLRILYDIRREMRLYSAYLSGYYTRKFAYSKKWGGDDVRSLEVRNAPSHARVLLRLEASDKYSICEGQPSDCGGTDDDAERVFDYVSCRDEAE